MNITRRIKLQLNTKRGQILLPSVLLVPLFILVIYLLFDLTNLSMTKVQHQFALDNAAYSQMSSISSYLNAMAMVNGPSLYRVMVEYKNKPVMPASEDKNLVKPENVFNLFYKAGAFPSVGPDHEEGSRANPSPDSVNWDVAYYPHELPEDKGILNDKGHSKWMVPHPTPPGDKEDVVILNKDYIKNAAITMDRTVEEVAEYLKWVFYLGNIYDNLSYTFKQLTRNGYMFRSGYFVNVGNCKITECGKESAKTIVPYLNIDVKAFEVDKVRLYFNDWSPGASAHEPWPLTLTSAELKANRDMFLFSHFTPKSLGLVQKMDRGVVLKQPYNLPANHFNKNLNTKYKPIVHTTVYMQCPRKGNNCLWPNPLPKYSVFLRP